MNMSRRIASAIKLLLRKGYSVGPPKTDAAIQSAIQAALANRHLTIPTAAQNPVKGTGEQAEH